MNNKQVFFLGGLLIVLALAYLGHQALAAAIVVPLLTWAYGKEGQAEPVAMGMMGYDKRSEDRTAKSVTE